MTQEERRRFLIRYLAKEEREFQHMEIPAEEGAQKRLLRSLMNIRPPRAVSEEFISVQDAYLRQEQAARGTVALAELSPVRPGIYLWQGDITRLAVDAIVNAANRGLLGCFVPCHGCIDNAIHSAAGVQLRQECARLMAGQSAPEPTGRARLTKAYNLPCRYILHTVGPVIQGAVTKRDCQQLADCYRSCLELAAEHHLSSVAFCCISTGEFHFPRDLAAEIAVRTVEECRETMAGGVDVVFNVFRDEDYEIYERLLR